ncbi:MAG TPA: YegS/Rv2252/BmrU family lipid kinase [Ignavibacteria bacterium]|nr:YegS/Rv2252/BmrU family lipid kinase [Ignavibacteria bacterium]
MKPYAFIINPVAGKVKKLDIHNLIESNATRFKIKTETYITKRPGHAIEISKHLTRNNKYYAVIAVGGDGTVNEVVNGFNLTSEALFGLLPFGSGNDVGRFIYSNGNSNYFDILFDQTRHSIVELDVGDCTIKEQNETIINRRFINAVGIGFDAYVAYLNQFEKKLSGILSYILAVMRALKSIKNLDVNIKLDGEEIIGKFLLLTVGNGKTSGGGFFLNPDADPTDGVLNLTSVDSGSRFDVIKNLPYALVDKLKKVKKAKFFLSRDINIKLNEPYYVHLDGEIGSQAAIEFNILLAGKKLKTIKSK